METRTQARLLKLSDSNLSLADSGADIRGRKVMDAAGEEIGHVDDLLIDDREGRVRFLQVAEGGLFGLGETKFLLPVDAVVGLNSEIVVINQSREHMAGAPRYDPELIEDRHLDEVSGYYGYGPFWAAGYAYPSYPYYF